MAVRSESAIVWRPTDDYVSRSRLLQFMRRHGIDDYDTLFKRSITDLAWFWNERLNSEIGRAHV